MKTGPLSIIQIYSQSAHSIKGLIEEGRKVVANVESRNCGTSGKKLEGWLMGEWLMGEWLMKE